MSDPGTGYITDKYGTVDRTVPEPQQEGGGLLDLIIEGLLGGKSAGPEVGG